MPTSYTEPLHSGTPITFEQFVLRCSRAMGAAIMQRDESLDVEIQLREVSDYEIAAVDLAGNALAQALQRTDEEWTALQAATIAKAEQFRTDYVAKKNGIRERYVAMFEQVRAWKPPTAEHLELKKFMVDQIEESLRFDVGTYEPTVPAELPVAEFREQEVGKLARDLGRATERLEQERERVRGQNAWVIALRESLTSQEGA